MTDKFDQMQITVDALCKSMVDTPFNWELSTYTIEFNGLSLWKDDLTKYWNGHGSSVIFSEQQGRQLTVSLRGLESVISSRDQEVAIRAVAVKTPAPVKVSWWKRLTAQ